MKKLKRHNFLPNKYYRWYVSIIAKAKDREQTGYTERHHIIPKALGGSNKKDNCVDLTFREHFIVHWLLIKFTVGADRHKMMYALLRMTHNTKKKSRVVAAWQYELVKHTNSEAIRLLSKEDRLKVGRKAGWADPAEMSRRGKIGGAGYISRATPEERSRLSRVGGLKGGAASLVSYTRTERSKNMRAYRASLTKEEKRHQGRAAGLAASAANTPEQLSQRSKIGHQKRIMQSVFREWQKHSNTWSGCRL